MRFKNLISLIIVLGFLYPRAGSCLEQSFIDKLTQLKWIAYAPTNFDPQRQRYPDVNSLEADLLVLKNAGFNGVVTYGSENSLALIPQLAKRVGFVGVIMGVWSPLNQEEMNNAIQQEPFVDGYCVGNEGYQERYDLKALSQAINFVKMQTDKPVTTTEQINDYFFNEDLICAGDWLFPNVHPFLFGMRKPKLAVSWTRDRYRALKNHINREIPILFKESGYPTKGGFGADAAAQEGFFNLLEKSDVPFVYFEAFDQPWKRHLRCEPFWGLFDQERQPKRFIQNRIEQLLNSPRSAQGLDQGRARQTH